MISRETLSPCKRLVFVARLLADENAITPLKVASKGCALSIADRSLGHTVMSFGIFIHIVIPLIPSDTALVPRCGGRCGSSST